ncbi:cytochrome P450 [Guillardia theta CCMP2712]|uniref:Cytochrome P450 n=1 Tax=Guillardia theta (strain CCMP2712) TaxID=905079 RepID=L1J3M5_GUITC|nr:cytochrome P450 [Guillardia theta CCMP2712]EKX43116.1 cytochrome P450 [Guillardia theta CCMP2712]|eukprot:XP_005830096.1 cytochrome P450 [Guillardia theta CCMP2712]
MRHLPEDGEAEHSYKVCLLPKAFLIVSDPTVVRHILSENALKYDKGILADILEPIMGKGLIPADLPTWQPRRRAVVPGFHSSWLQSMMAVGLFSRCSDRMVGALKESMQRGMGPMSSCWRTQERAGEEVDLESMYSSVALDIIGEAVFNFKFLSVQRKSPVIDAVYNLMQEAEHRSFFLLPYWKVPVLGFRFLGLGPLVERQQRFEQDIELINDCLDELIKEALLTRSEEDIETLQKRDYDALENPSLLRFLVDMRGADATERQLRDDLMTMMIAGHETTAALLTWTTFCLLTNPEEMKKVHQEIEDVLGGRRATYEDILKMEKTRLALAEALRLYPQPPILIRRALDDDVLPLAWGNEKQVKVFRGTDIFMLVWNLHRSPVLWGDDADAFRPDRWLSSRSNPDVPGWEGYKPNMKNLYPNEVSSDFAFCPFGAGPRKCIGDQFAFLESVVILSRVLQEFDIQLATSPEEVGMTTGATIHTEKGLKVSLRARKNVPAA